MLVSSGRFRPTEPELLVAYRKMCSCGRVPGVNAPCCADKICPACWEKTATLESTSIRCSRFNHFAPLVASSGTGYWKGGDARSAMSNFEDGQPSDAWVLGAGVGQDVEIHKKKPRVEDDGRDVDVGSLTMGKIVYFFDHTGNKRSDRCTGSTTRWVLVFEYVSAGVGNDRLPDVATRHPVLRLRGNAAPVVFPAGNIRRHVHLYHMCPDVVNLEGGARGVVHGSSVCGLHAADDGRASVWRHAFKLAVRNLPGSRVRGEDKYLLNEHHHSIFRDSFVG
ncbi:unnamed protein product [Hapterophycus canaliculatus]